MDSNYLVIEEYSELPTEEAPQRAKSQINIIEEYDIIPSISNQRGWEEQFGKRGADAKPRMTLNRFLHI